MTPKEKAIELVDKFRKHSGRGISEETLRAYDKKCKDGELKKSFNGALQFSTGYYAKQCALIAVDEMIAENESTLEMLKTHGDDRTILPVKFRIMFLKSVKEQIDLL